MLRTVIAAVFACLALVAQAAPISFVNPTFQTDAIALAQGTADVQTATSPPGGLPVSSEALAIGSTDVATAGALGAPGFLSTSADVTAITDLASAVGSVLFTGTMIGDHTMRLFIDFNIIGFALDTGFESASLFLTLTSNGTTLVDEVITASTSRFFQFDLPTGTGVLELLLVSEAQAGIGPGAAFNLGIVQFQAVVPLLPTYAFVALGLVVMAALGRRKRQTPAH